MPTVLIAAVAVGLAAASGAVGSDPSAAPLAAPASGAQVVWTQIPNGGQLSALYPERARDVGLEGRSIIECRIANDGGLVGCRVLAESRLNFGFGRAALDLAPDFRARATDTAGASTIGRIVRVPVDFHLQRDPAELAEDVKVETPGVMQKPIPTSRVSAPFPPTARQAGASGQVKVRGAVGADGALSAIAVEESSGSAELDQAATEAFAGWVFQPGLDAAKKPIAATVAVTFVFDIDLEATTCAEALAQVRWFSKTFPQKTVKDMRLFVFTRTFLGMKAMAAGPEPFKRLAQNFQTAFDNGLQRRAGQPDARFYDLVKSLL
jgi:TonB family protein